MGRDPNILFIVIDALRYDSLSITGYRRNGRKTTPNIDELSKHSTFYTEAIATGPSTNHSQTSLMTGLYPSNMDYAGAHTELKDKTSTLAEDLKQEGYSTLGIHTAMLNRDEAFGRGFDEYYEAVNMPKFKLEKDYITSGVYNLLLGKDSRTRHKNRILRRYIGNEEHHPFFSYICYTNTHNPYRATRKFRKKFERDVEKDMNEELIDYISGPGSPNRAIAESGGLSEDERDVIRSRYDAGLAYLDYRLGRLFSYMKEQGIYDDTMIIVTSDHGELFGEDGLFYHALSTRQELLHVPLIVKEPNQEEGEVVEEPVSLIDLYPTILEKAGIDLEDVEFDGKALTEEAERIPLSEMASPKKERISDLKERGVENPEKFDKGKKIAQDRDFKLVKTSKGGKKLIDKASGEEMENSEAEEKLQEAIEEGLSGFWSGEESIETEEEIKEELEKLGYF